MKDHLQRFVEETFELDPSGYCSHSALLRCYLDWCAAHQVVNRQLPFLVLLMELEDRYGAKAKMSLLSEDRSRTIPGERQRLRADGHPPVRVYVVCGLRFKHRQLNRRPSPDARVPVSRIWKGVAEGSVLDTIEPVELPTPFDDDALP